MKSIPIGKILVVDDEPDLRFVLLSHFQAAGFDTLEAKTGLSAIELANKHLPDVILMDVGLPGMDGVETTVKLKDNPRTAAIPVIMLTGQSTSDAVIRGLNAGAHEYISKPFDPSELLARVRTVFRLASTQKDLDRLNAELEAEVDLKTFRLQLLNEYMSDLNHAVSEEDILDLVVRCAKRTTGATRLSLFLVDPSHDHLICKRAVGIDPKIVDQIQKTSMQGITGQVFQTAKTLAASAFGVSGEPAGGYNRKSFVSTPLRASTATGNEGTLGVLNVTEKTDESPFSDEEVECIRSIADAGAIALANMIRRDQLQQSVRVLLRTVGQLAEYRDEETTEHLERVTKMSRILAQEVANSEEYADAVNDEFVEQIVQAAPMHDLGKVGIPDEILTKPGKLTHEEFEIMKTHTEIGRRVLSQVVDPTHAVPMLKMCVEIAHCHHERYDGSGYPSGLTGRDIPLSARIIALVDAYDAITSKRRYKDPQTHEQAVNIITEEAGHHFDPVLVDAFLRCQAEFDEVRAKVTEPVALPKPCASVTR